MPSSPIWLTSTRPATTAGTAGPSPDDEIASSKSPRSPIKISMKPLSSVPRSNTRAVRPLFERVAASSARAVISSKSTAPCCDVASMTLALDGTPLPSE